jgi:hypothetical protein
MSPDSSKALAEQFYYSNFLLEYPYNPTTFERQPPQSPLLPLRGTKAKEQYKHRGKIIESSPF